ncbi:Endonuclease/Exonuclease/phosphatase family protein [Pseudobythopirellula maris]|uniref:Endonuclease/Exonuclease/phosphatase family protein n=1 Tax=Pseudobythopirellula maris TaxID=2527991 RepID=A0A5C5ZRL8_9BACT|nr:endonuclease/exonuclease/phosphatase family protein [Pseudobythopirellula maris]TWT90154.1 Endonuclease/Exonuclease/phosphatase family protein [Pseudobythopirellula maris]
MTPSLRCAALSLTALLLSPLAVAETPVRLVTFNAEILTAPRVRAGQLNKFRFDYARTEHLERVAHVIETLSPDILNLVEVTSVEAVDQLVELLHAKGMDDYQGYHVESNDSFSGMDVALITRLPVDEVDGAKIRTIYSERGDPTWSQAFSFTGWEGDHRTSGTSLSRNAMYFMTVDGWKLGFMGLHLKSNPSDNYSNAKRGAEAVLVQRAIRGEITPRGYLPVVLGDLNDYDPEVPDRDETRSTVTTVIADLKDYDPESPGPELFNSAKFIKRQEDRYTSHWDWNENGAADSDDVMTMIDHVLLPTELEPFVKRVHVAHVVGLDTSDHFPVVVDLVLPHKE